MSITHSGIVEACADGVVTVRIMHGGQCGSCKAKGGCPSASLGESGHSLDIKTERTFSIGQPVEVALRNRTDFLAIVLAFAVPVFLLVVAIMALVQLGFSQAVAALGGLGAVAVWLFVLFLFRKRLQARFEMVIVS